uniref:Lectizyme n=1 Tax=Glossina brevipalpis TaxID=37001 RepID=A0A1A9W0W5_9MUSC
MTKVQALFEDCNHVINMKAKEKFFINSPNYPQSYPLHSACRYLLKAPINYQIKVECKLRLKLPPSATDCHQNIFYFNAEGNELFSESEYFCGLGEIERTSFLNQAVISYISTIDYKNHNRYARQAMATNEDITISDSGTRRSNLSALAKPTINETRETKETRKQIARTRKTTITTSSATVAASNSTTTIFAFANISMIFLKTLPTHEQTGYACVVASLSNKFDTKTFTKPTQTTNVTTSVSSKVKSAQRRSKISFKRAGKIFTGHRNRTEIGVSFSCLVETIEATCECGRSSATIEAVKVTTTSQTSDVNDGVAGVNEFPSMAGVMTVKYKQIFCGAAIIHQRYLLSAAHCFITSETNKAELLQVVVGEHDLSTDLETPFTRYYTIQNIIRHENFRSTSTKISNDITLLKASIDIEFNHGVAPACLPFHFKAFQLNDQVLATGWGTTSFGGPQSSILLKTTLDIIKSDKCEKLTLLSLTKNIFCTFTPGRDTCQYDSGGALYQRDNNGRLFTIGLISYGFACAGQKPSINTRIRSYLKWIKMKTPEIQFCVI